MTINESYRKDLINNVLGKTNIAGKWKYLCYEVIDMKDGTYTIHIEKSYRKRSIATGENFVTDEHLSDPIEIVKRCIF